MNYCSTRLRKLFSRTPRCIRHWYTLRMLKQIEREVKEYRASVGLKNY